MSAASVLPTLREAFVQRPDWREFSLRQLSVLMFLYGYMSCAEPAYEFEIVAALPFALEDFEGAA